MGTSIIAAVTASDFPERETKKANSLAYQGVKNRIIDKHKDKNPDLLKYKSYSKPAERSARFAESVTQLREAAENENKKLNDVGQAMADVGVAGAQRIEDPTLRDKVGSLIGGLRIFFD